MGAPRGGRLRAWAELLRAPLLPSAAADVLAGWSVAFSAGVGFVRIAPGHDDATIARAGAAGLALAGWDALLRAALCGTCLLAAGMAQNAVADLAEDRRVKPGRPIPRGDVRPAAAHVAWIALTAAGMALAATLGADVLRAASGIVVLSALYHLGLKRRRLAGCLALGAARALDLALGGLALVHASRRAPQGSALSLLSAANLDDLLLFVPAYAAYVTGAALHASTDDQPDGGRAWSTAGLLACCAVLAGVATAMLQALAGASALAGWRLAGPVLLALALARLLRAWRSRPAPAVTGTALSNVYLWDAAVVACGTHAALASGGAALVLLLFAASRLLLRGFPPS